MGAERGVAGSITGADAQCAALKREGYVTYAELAAELNRRGEGMRRGGMLSGQAAWLSGCSGVMGRHGLHRFPPTCSFRTI